MLENIGVDYTLLAFQIINFIVLMWLLKKFLYRPILKLIENRQKEIDDSLKLKEEIEKKEEELGKEKEKMLQETREESQLLIEKLKRDAGKIKDKIIKEGKKEKDAIIKKAQVQIDAERKKMEAQVEKEAIELAAMMASKVLSSILSDDLQHKLIKKEVDKLTGVKFKKLNK
jgi:F-type H+-transporting ATPase subunit b